METRAWVGSWMWRAQPRSSAGTVRKPLGSRARRLGHRWSLALAWLLGVMALPLVAHAQATLITGLGGATGFGANVLAMGDDNSSAAIALAPYDLAGLCFFGAPHTTMFINNNGNITFNSATGDYTPDPFPASSNPMMAPWWSDVYTSTAVASPAGANRVYWDIRQVGGLGQIVVTWYLVGYYAANPAVKLNTFQIVIRETAAASGTTPADYTVEYRYGQLQWTTGSASGGTLGLGGTPAQAGFDAGDFVHYSQLPGSRTAAVLNLATSSNLVPAQPGLWRFAFHSCQLACAGNADCAGPTPICDSASHTCRACGADADCSSPTGFCATTGANVGRCVQCNVAVNCATGTCTANACVCAGNASCPSGQSICDTTAHTCRSCDPAKPADCTGTRPVCGASGNCVQCGPGLIAQCTSPNVACSGDGSCVQCAPGNTAACTGATPICDSASFTCRGCTVATQSADCPSALSPACNGASGACAAAAVTLTSPPAGTSATTADTTPLLAGTGVPGQAVIVTAGGTTVCTATVSAGGLWSCTSIALPLGSATIVASSDGLTSTGTLAILCASDGSCSSGQVCDLGTGLCSTPACRGNAGAGSGADCPSATPVCANPGTASAACGACLAGTVYDTTHVVCVAPAIGLTTPQAGGSSGTISQRDPLAGTGVPGQIVVVTANGVMECMAVVAPDSSWTCVPTMDLPIGNLTVTATSAGATSAGTLVVACTVGSQCGGGQVCNATSGSCVTPACLGSSGSSSGSDCPAATPVCLTPNTAGATCSTCPMAAVYNSATFACVPPSVAFTAPAAGMTTTTTNLLDPLAGTGVPGQTVSVVAGGVMVCSTTVSMAGTWVCTPTSNLMLGSLTLIATSAGATSTAVLVVACTLDAQCTSGQVCDGPSGACVTPACLGNAGAGSGGDCPAGAPVCTSPNTSSAACGPCATGQVYSTASLVCVLPAVVLTSPMAGATTSTTNLLSPIQGTGIAGQTVGVTANGLTICTAVVAMDNTWSCTPMAPLTLGMLTIAAISGGATSSATLNVECTLDAQCVTGQVCNTLPGVCVAPACRGNAGAGSAADCPAATPVCAGPGTALSACAACATGQIYNPTALACVAPSVVLTNPPDGGSAMTTAVRPTLAGTGVPGQSVLLTANGMSACTTTVGADGGWSCIPMFDLALGAQIIVATSAGVSSTGTLVVDCTADTQCVAAQVCNPSSGACVTPACRANAGSGAAGGNCPDASPVCSAPGTATAACGTCPAARVYNHTSFVCVVPVVVLSSPPADSATATTNVLPVVSGTGVPGQAVSVTANGVVICSTTVDATGAWMCTSSTGLILGSNTIVATSSGAASSGVLVVECKLDGQCGGGQACNLSSGVCVTPSCRGNAGSGSTADCTPASPVCTAAATSDAACGACAPSQVFNTATFACVSPVVALTSPPTGTSSSGTDPLAPITGTGVPGQSVSVAANGQSVCTASVSSAGVWTCTPALALSVGPLMVTATSAGATSTATLVLLCTGNPQCTMGQLCNTTSGLCTAPSCRGNAGSGSAADCPAASPVCGNPGTLTALCGPCGTGQVYDTSGHACVSPVVALTSPPTNGSAKTQQVLPSIAGTGVPGQSVTVSVNGMTICTVTVKADGTWSCVPSASLPLGSDTLTANSAGIASSATLVVECTKDAQCGAGQVCTVATTGACTTPNCTANAGAGSTANCPSATPICTNPGSVGATCGACATGQVFDTAGHLCVAGTVTLTAPPASGTATTTSVMPAVSGTGVPGQSVTVTSGSQTLCVTIVLPDGTWTCSSTVLLSPGSNVITASSAGITSTATLVEHCTLDAQCSSGAPACDVTTGLCVACVLDASCASGTFCDGTRNTCTATLGSGATCDRGAECASGVCTAGKCGSAQVDGGASDARASTDARVGDAGARDGADGAATGAAAQCDTSGCGCTTAGAGASGEALAGLALVLLAVVRRPTRRRPGKTQAPGARSRRAADLQGRRR
jgi:hypothetical protein